jgi:hypothetical protein
MIHCTIFSACWNANIDEHRSSRENWRENEGYRFEEQRKIFASFREAE